MKTLEETVSNNHACFKIVKLGNSTFFSVLYCDSANCARISKISYDALILNPNCHIKSVRHRFWALSTSSENSTITEISTVPKAFLMTSFVLDCLLALSTGFVFAYKLAWSNGGVLAFWACENEYVLFSSRFSSNKAYALHLKARKPCIT